jgi:hypothetical protein
MKREQLYAKRRRNNHFLRTTFVELDTQISQSSATARNGAVHYECYTSSTPLISFNPLSVLVPQGVIGTLLYPGSCGR